MFLRLTEINVIGKDEYEAILTDEAGKTERVVCRIVKRRGVKGVSMEPDLVMPTQANQLPRIESREVVAAVLEYHRHHLEQAD